VVNQRAAPGYEAPYPLAIVELDEGPRLLTNILGGGRLELDAPVEVVFEERDGHSVPQFRLCSGGGSA
jgi:uncharacterized OB-fold protein